MGSAAAKSIGATLDSSTTLSGNEGTRSFDYEISPTNSTPEGMSIPESITNSFDTSVIELPPIVTKIPSENKAGGELFSETVNQSTEISITDPDMDVYRIFSAKAYQLIDF